MYFKVAAKRPHLVDKKRYARHIMLQEIGEAGQEKLLSSSVLVIGGGGLGSPVLLYLAAAGVGIIGLVDYDVVSLSNLQRQVLYTTDEVDKPKVICAQEKLLKLNPGIEVKTYFDKIDEHNSEDIIQEYDLVVSAVDNIRVRYIVNEACVNQGIVFIDGSIHSFEGQIMLIIPGKTACYQCVFPDDNKAIDEKNETLGLIGTLPGVIGTLQANEAIKHILGIGTMLGNSFLYYDALSLSFRKLAIEKNSKCKVCKHV